MCGKRNWCEVRTTTELQYVPVLACCIFKDWHIHILGPFRDVCGCSSTLAEEIKHVGVYRDEQEPAGDSGSDSAGYFNC